MSNRVISGLIVLATFAVWIIWDIYAILTEGVRATLSVVITDFSYYSPAWPLIIGFLCGHWFFPPSRRNLKDITRD